MPILHRYIAKELLSVALLAVLILTSLMALCGLLQPLREHGLTATEMLKILVLLFPFFLIFTVPIAVMVSCCWVYGRLSADNELNACSSSGINIQTLLIVPLLLGLGAMVLNVVLANWLVPNWALDRFEILLAKHGKEIVYRHLRRRGSFTLGPHQFGRRSIIHADHIDPDNDILYGIGVAVFAKDSRQIESIITAHEARLQFFSSGEKGEVLDSIAVVPLEATVVELPEYDTYKAANMVFRGRIRQRIRQRLSAMSLGDLMAMEDDPELHHTIRHSTQKARRIFIASELVKKLQGDLRRDGYFELNAPQARYRFTGRRGKAVFGEEGARNILEDATIKEYFPGAAEPARIFEDVDRLNLELVELPGDMVGSKRKNAAAPLTASMVLRNARIKLIGAGKEDLLEQTRFSIGELTIPEDILRRAAELSLEDITQGKFARGPAKGLRNLGEQIDIRLSKLLKEIALEIHSRMAMAVSCPVLAILGALLGAIFRKGQFLVAVGLSLLPAMVAFLFIIMGQRMADSKAFSTEMAVGVAWTGLLLLIAANVVLLTKVLKR